MGEMKDQEEMPQAPVTQKIKKPNRRTSPKRWQQNISTPERFGGFPSVATVSREAPTAQKETFDDLLKKPEKLEKSKHSV